MNLVRIKRTSTPPLMGLFDEFLSRPFGELLYNGSNTVNPAVNILETDNAYGIELAAPGMEKQDFAVNVEDGVLTISADRKVENEEKEGNYTRREFNFTSFQRSFTLPDTVQSEKISAKYENGVLKLLLPKVEEAATKPIKTIEIG